MKKSVVLLSMTILLFLSGCASEPQKIAPGNKPNPTPLTQEEQAERKAEQERQWEEQRKQQEQMNQDAINTMTMMIPAIM